MDPNQGDNLGAINPEIYQGNILSPQQLASMRQNSQSLQQPIKSPAQGLSNMVGSLFDGYQQYKQQNPNPNPYSNDSVPVTGDLTQYKVGGVNAPLDSGNSNGPNLMGLLQGLFGGGGSN